MTDKSCTCAFHPELTTWHLPSCPLAVAPPASLDSAIVVAADRYARTPTTENREAVKAAVRALTESHLTPDEAETVRLVACGLRGAPDGTRWDNIVSKLRHLGERDV